jgi:hypothetical protein
MRFAKWLAELANEFEPFKVPATTNRPDIKYGGTEPGQPTSAFPVMSVGGKGENDPPITKRLRRRRSA